MKSQEKSFKGNPKFSPCMGDPDDKLLSTSLIFSFHVLYEEFELVLRKKKGEGFYCVIFKN